VRHFSSGQGGGRRGRQGTAGDGRGRQGTAGDRQSRWGTTGDRKGRQGTARVMSHDVKRIRLEVYDQLG